MGSFQAVMPPESAQQLDIIDFYHAERAWEVTARQYSPLFWKLKELLHNEHSMTHTAGIR